MKKLIIILLALLIVLSPLSATTNKVRPNKSYIGAAIGYNGVHDSLIVQLAKIIGIIFTGGLAEDDLLNENALALGLDGYFEITDNFSLATSAGCSLSFNSEGMVPSPFMDMIFYGRIGDGAVGDFLMGGGIGSYNLLRETGLEGYLALITAMRYQMDLTEHVGWGTDLYIGWNAFQYGKDDFRFISDGFKVWPSIRTSFSYAF